MNSSGYAAPVNTFGSSGDFAVVTATVKMTYWKKVGTTWILLGDIGSPNFSFANFAPTNAVAGDVYVRLTRQGGWLKYKSIYIRFDFRWIPCTTSCSICVR